MPARVCLWLLMLVVAPLPAQQSGARQRARDLKLPFEGTTGVTVILPRGKDARDVRVHGLPHDKLVEVLRKYGRIQE